MPETKWTDAQLSAIQTHGKTLLVSAAAGSGKTATLTERIIRRITEGEPPADLSRMLIVTFTRAAASDLKVKITRALSEALAAHPTDRHLSSQIMMLGSANICTIDSFYFDVLKSNFSKLSLPGNLRIADTAEIALLYRSVMEETIDEFYATDNTFEDFVDHFADIRSTDRVAEIFISIYEKLLSFREGVDLLERYSRQMADSVGKDFFKTPYGETALTEIRATLEYVSNIMRTAEDHFATDMRLDEAYSPSFRYDRQCAKRALALVTEGNYAEARQILLGFSPLRLKSIRNTDEYTNRLKAMRTAAHKLIRGLADDFFSLSPEEIDEHMQTTAEICGRAHRFLSAFDRRLAREKLSRGICDFPDVRRFVMKLIVNDEGGPTPLALDMRERFDEIYIDEYQDTDEVQDLIFRTIAKPNNRFMVGDIKQSIYSFRGAEPSIFAGYKRTLPPLGEADSDGYSIFMSNNFRCDQNIIRFSNLISSYLFRNCGESIEYSKEDDLIFSKKAEEGYCSPRVVLALSDVSSTAEDGDEPSDEAENGYDPEALYITREILRLCREERKADGSPITPGDIAILMRSKKNMTALMDTLRAFGIPAASSEEHSFFENPDVLLVLSLLCTIDNPQKDIPLSGTLCSPFYGFSLEDLIDLRCHGEEKMSLYDALVFYAESEEDALSARCRAFLSSLDYWREQARSLPVDKLLRKLYRELAILSMQGSAESNLIRLYEYARSFESGSFRGLYGFVRYVTELIESGAEISGGSDDGNGEAVRLMSIHHSKGLEFPVCFIYGAGSPFNTTFKRDKIQFEPSVGIGFPIHDASGLGYYDTPIRRAVINSKSRLGREEEMRVLYVAMTRARERLYVTATVKHLDKMMENAKNLAEFGKAFGIIGARSYLEWMLAAICDAGEHSPLCDCFTTVITDNAPLIPTEAAPIPSAARAREPEAEPMDGEITEVLRRRFSYTYPFEHVSDLPAKLSVSRLYPAILDEDDLPEPTVEESSEDEFLEKSFRLPSTLMTKRPPTAADRGTATHTFLQFCDFERVTQVGVREELARLTEMHFIPREMAELVDIGQLNTFFEGPLFHRIRTARRMWREQRFNLFLPAAEFTEDAEKAALLAEETITVQGVIDLFFEDEDGRIVLCDYKTDYLTPEEQRDPALAAKKLTARHGLQLTYYTRAIREICGKAPSEVLIYSLALGDSVSVEQET